MKRILSIVLILTMLTALFAGVFSASAAGSTKNTGTRHELCKALSSQALAYYTGTNTWESLSELDGKATTSSVTACGSPLFNALHNLMWNTLTNTVTYKSLTSYWKETDASGGSSDACLIYADEISSSYNREHVWPKSHGNFYESGAGSDLHHLRPSDSTINSTRSHWTYGNVKELCSSYKTAAYNGKTVLWYDTGYSANDCLGLVEIKDDVKGDIARIILYVYVTYGKTSGENLNLFTKTSSSGSGNSANTGDKIIYDLATLLEWCENDPVDTWEMSRNDCCANVQGNRNVFIDYPEFAWLLFGQEVPDMDTPSGMAHEMQDASSYTVTAVSGNPDMGTVSGSGRYFTATPKDGYYVSDYTLEPANAAAVTQSGNTFSVSKPTCDCTLTVFFAPKMPITVTFNTPAGVSCAAMEGYAGESITLPTPTGKPTGEYEYSFKGWVTATVDNATEKPSEIRTAGSSFIPTDDTVLYALYSYTVGGTGSSTTFTKITNADEMKNGASYVFTSSTTGKSMSTDVGSNWVNPGAAYTGDTIENPPATVIWTVTDGIIGCSAGNLTCSGAKSISLTEEGSIWTISKTGNDWSLVSNSCTLSFNSSGWRPYAGDGYGSDKTFCIYMSGNGGTVYYTTVIGTPCEHTYQTTVKEPTCTKAGYTTYTCTKCGNTYIADEVAALGHNYVVQTVPPTTTDKGYDLHTCTRCGDTYKDNYVLPIDPVCDHHRTELVGAEQPDCTHDGYTGDVYCVDCGALLETGETISALGHNYVDGVCTRCGEEDPNYVPPEPVDPCEGYTDIDRSSWYHIAADFVIERGLMGSTKTDELTFEPNTKVSRAMVASILYRMANSPAVTYKATFTDVSDGKWFTNAIEWCAQNGLASGKGAGKFDPNGNVTRQELAVFMKKMAEYLGKNTDSRDDLTSFADASKVPSWAKDYVAWAVSAGLISGKASNGKTYLAPTDNATRAEFASIIMRFVRNIAEP